MRLEKFYVTGFWRKQGGLFFIFKAPKNTALCTEMASKRVSLTTQTEVASNCYLPPHLVYLKENATI